MNEIIEKLTKKIVTENYWKDLDPTDDEEYFELPAFMRNAVMAEIDQEVQQRSIYA